MSRFVGVATTRQAVVHGCTPKSAEMTRSPNSMIAADATDVTNKSRRRAGRLRGRACRGGLIATYGVSAGNSPAIRSTICSAMRNFSAWSSDSTRPSR